MKNFKNINCIVSDDLNMCVDTNVLDDLIDEIDDILDDNEVIQSLKKIGISVDVKYMVDTTMWEDYIRFGW